MADDEPRAKMNVKLGELICGAQPVLPNQDALDDQALQIYFDGNKTRGLVGVATEIENGCIAIPAYLLLGNQSHEESLRAGDPLERTERNKFTAVKKGDAAAIEQQRKQRQYVKATAAMGKQPVTLYTFINDWCTDMFTKPEIHKLLLMAQTADTEEKESKASKKKKGKDQDAPGGAKRQETNDSASRPSTEIAGSEDGDRPVAVPRPKQADPFDFVSRQLNESVFKMDLNESALTGDVILFSDDGGSHYYCYGVVFRPFMSKEYWKYNLAKTPGSENFQVIIRKERRIIARIQERWRMFLSVLANKITMPFLHYSLIDRFLSPYSMSKVAMWIDSINFVKLQDPPRFLLELTRQRSNSVRVGYSNDGQPLKKGLHATVLEHRLEMFMDPKAHASSAVGRQFGIVRCTSYNLFRVFREYFTAKEITPVKNSARSSSSDVKEWTLDNYNRNFNRFLRTAETEFRRGVLDMCQTSEYGHETRLLSFWIFVNLSVYLKVSVDDSERDPVTTDTDDHPDIIKEFQNTIHFYNSTFNGPNKRAAEKAYKKGGIRIMHSGGGNYFELSTARNKGRSKEFALLDLFIRTSGTTESNDLGSETSALIPLLTQLMRNEATDIQNALLLVQHKLQPKSAEVVDDGISARRRCRNCLQRISPLACYRRIRNRNREEDAAAGGTNDEDIEEGIEAAVEDMEVVDELAIERDAALRARLRGMRDKRRAAMKEYWEKTAKMWKEGSGSIYVLLDVAAILCGVSMLGAGSFIATVFGQMSRVRMYHNLNFNERNALNTIDGSFRTIAAVTILNTPLRWIWPLGIPLDFLCWLLFVCIVGFASLAIRKDTIVKTKSELFIVSVLGFPIMFVAVFIPWWLFVPVLLPAMLFFAAIFGLILAFERGAFKNPFDNSHTFENELKNNGIETVPKSAKEKKLATEKLKRKKEHKRMDEIKNNILFVYPKNENDRLVPLPVAFNSIHDVKRAAEAGASASTAPPATTMADNKK